MSKAKNTAPVRAELKVENVWATIDTRENNPPPLGMPSIITTLKVGDYGLRDAPDLAALERKGEDDLLSCVGVDRERADWQMKRLLLYPVRGIIVESTWDRIEAGNWRSRVTPSAVMGSLIGWSALGIPIFMAGNNERAGVFITRILFTAARRRWRELRAMHKAMLQD